MQPLPDCAVTPAGTSHIAVHHQRGCRVFSVRDVPESPDGQALPLAGSGDGKAVHAPIFGVAEAKHLLIAGTLTTPLDARDTLCSIIVHLLLLQRRLHAVEKELNHLADGLIGNGPADEPAVFAGAQGGPEHLDDPRLALCATLCPKDFILSPLDEVEDERLYRGA